MKPDPTPRYRQVFTAEAKDRLTARSTKSSLVIAKSQFQSDAEGDLHLPRHTLLVTLSGGTKVTETRFVSGPKYSGFDKPGDVSFIPAHMERRSCFREGAFEWAALTFDEDANSPVFIRRPNGNGLGIPPFTNRSDPFLKQLMFTLKRDLQVSGCLDALYLDCVTDFVRHYLVRRYAKSNTAYQPRTTALDGLRFRKVRAYIDSHLDTDIRLSDLAAIADLEASYFIRAFKSATGLTPYQFLLEKRIQHAARLLAETNMPIADIAYKSGFSNQSHLTSVFGKIMGTTPAVFRKTVNG